MRPRTPSVAFVVATLALAASVAFAVMRFGGFSTFIITGRSMEPAIPVGSVTIVQSVAPGAVQVGDVVTFSHGGRVVTHRLVAMESDGTFRTKGDANEVADPEQLTFMGRAGVVRAHIPLVGFALAGWRQYAQAGALVTTTLCLTLALLLMRRRPLDRALACSRRGDHAGAIAILRSAVARHPLDRVAHRRLAAALTNTGDDAAATDEYARYLRAVRARSENELASEELAYAYATLARPDGLALRSAA